MSANNLSEIEPFNKTPMEQESCQDHDDHVIIEGNLKINADINTEIETATHAEPLTPEEIRWFYKDGVDKRWNEFCGYDSLRIEKIYQERQCLLGQSNNETNNLPPAEKIVVRGGMYDVEIDNMKCVSIYWPGEEWEIMRGTWYYDNSWIPLETEHSKVIEEIHLKLFQKEDNNQSSSTCDTNAPQSCKATGYRLRRSYKALASMEDKPRDIDHIVFVVHDIVEAITPYSVLSIRHLLNTSAMDILYYTSPLYGAEVRAGLQKELNRLYFMFASRHPGWQGKVSILAHSLGCVIVYDIVTGWMGPDTRLPSPQAQEILLQGLQFPIENLFCLGSPLSVFLALRTRTPSNRLDVMPQGLCKRFYNIFHWSDPVAYRMEPLLERGYSKIEPVLIPPYGGVDGQQMPQSPSLSNVDPTLPPTVRGGWNVREGPSSPTPDSNPPIRPGQELAQRLDYVLRAIGLGRNYLYTVAAHTAYWSNYDVAYFVLTRLFPTLET
ncbi:hypothetical protein DMN91_000738 [Ooceraea biroi]|uniref:DDHD domain-containing protein n=1 Tax=Ooceraea biroi TaxID=2015173 RepID=A0A3L8E3Y5_OOCBI|nr:hypothetical protein DMN91_000738 [Ooceraea biroi]